MLREALVVSSFLFAAASYAALPPSPTLEEVARLREMSEIGLLQATEPFLVDPANREEARQFFRAVHGASESAAIEWTGNIDTGDAGDTAQGYKEATIVRVNYFRAMSGVPAGVVLNSVFGAKAQQAALMMSANNSLSHFPPASWTFYTEDGAEAARKSNLAIGSSGPDSISGYMLDHGASNNVVGHRRWIFYPQTEEMGTGDVPATASKSAANALWVQDANIFGARPATRDPYIGWPPRGHVPHQVVYARWSFSYPGADFSGATVTMSRDGGSIPVDVETRGSGSSLPDNTIVWLYDGKSGDDTSTHEKPTADVVYTVNVTGVLVSGSPQDFEYDVIVFDPDIAGADFAATSISGPASPVVGVGNSYAVNLPEFASAIQWRSLEFGTVDTTFGAEGDLQGVVADASAGYDVRVTDLVGAGGGAYHLAHPSPPEDQFLTLPGMFYLPAQTAGSLSFLSRLGLATSAQTARVQISTDDGVSWVDIYSQAGSDGSGESGFTLRQLPLDAVAGKTFQTRFAYMFPGNDSFFPQTSSTAGWVIDSISFSGVQRVTTVDAGDVVAGSSFSFSPLATGSFGLQAAGVLFGSFPMEWGPVMTISAVGDAPPADDAAIVNLSVRSKAGQGDETLIVGFVIGGSGSGSVLLRGIGPTLGGFGVPGFMEDPRLSLISDAGNQTNDNWGGTASLSAAFDTVGAFPLEAASLDAALLPTLPAGLHSVHVATSGDEGVALAEAYDTAMGGGTARFINLSARTEVGQGDDVLIAGFAIEGAGSISLVIRGIGPALAEFDVNGALQNPELKLFKAGEEAPFEQNDDWGGTAQLQAVFESVGAFPLADDSRDAAVLVTLDEGRYTAQVSGVGGTTGIGLVEVFENAAP